MNTEGKSYSSILIDLKNGEKVYRKIWTAGKHVVKHPTKDMFCVFVGDEHVGGFSPTCREQFAEDWFVVMDEEQYLEEDLKQEE